MADSAVPVSGGSGYNVDTRTESINGDHRQVVVLGDPVTGANVASVDANGRLVTATGGTSVTTPSPVTANTASNTYTVNTSAAGNLTFWIYNSGTSTSSGAITFEQSPDGTNWAPLPVVRSDTGAAITSLTSTTLAQNVGIAFDAAMEGVTSARMRVTTASGSANVFMYGVAGGLAFEPSVAITGSPTVTAPGITKGTQGGTGFTTQDLKDAGRLVFTFAGTAVAGVTTEALLSGTTQKGATQATAVTAPAVTSGKTLRITALDVSMRSGAAAIAWSRFVIRTSFTSTAVTATSPILAQIELITGSATSGVGDRAHLDFPDGIELASTVSFGITHVGSATTNIETFSLTGFEY